MKSTHWTLQESLEYFGEVRTDLTVGTKFQGVETPSQNRYVEYFEQIKNNFNMIVPKAVAMKVTTYWIIKTDWVLGYSTLNFIIKSQTRWPVALTGWMPSRQNSNRRFSTAGYLHMVFFHPFGQLGYTKNDASCLYVSCILRHLPNLLHVL